MSEDLELAGELEDKKDAGPGPENEVKRWLKEIDLATEEEKDWREDVKTAVDVFVGEEDKKGTKFNIYHANIQTIVPALYNSTPEPDVRRRHGDRDPVAKQSADVLERILSHEIDAYDFDGQIDATVQDMAIAGRGLARVTYNANLTDTDLKDETGEVVQDISYQSVGCEHIPWATFRRGPGRKWEDLPWVAFSHYYTKDGLRALCKDSKTKVDKIALDMRIDSDNEGAKDDNPNSDVFKRALVWEIWDKDTKKVIFVSPGYKEGPICVEDDPLGLEQFFPIPKPAQGAKRPGSLVPICEHKLTKTLYDELDKLTERITSLVSQLRARGITPGGQGVTDIQRWAEAQDGEIIEAANIGHLMEKSDVSSLIAWWPIEVIIAVLKGCYEQREMVKQAIYESTGIADILRGQSDPNETLGAQEIKQQWGSLRIQKRQQEVQRFIRDLLRLKAEIIANKFTPINLILASGLDQDPELGTPAPSGATQQQAQQPTAPQPQQGPPQGDPNAPPVDPMQQQMMMQQAQQAAMMAAQEKEAARQKMMADIVALMKNDVLRSYRIDIETDSTIRGDLTRNQRSMAEFVQGSGQYFQAMAPAVESGAMSMEGAVTIYSAFCRNFKLGKQVDDILDKMADEAAKAGPKPDPEAQKMQMEMEKMKAEMGMDMQKMQGEMQMMQQKLGMEQQLGEMDMQMKGAELQFKQQEHAIDIHAKQEDRQFEQQAIQQDRMFDIQGQHIELQAKQQAARQDLDFKKATGQQQLQLQKQKAAQKPKAQARN